MSFASAEKRRDLAPDQTGPASALLEAALTEALAYMNAGEPAKACAHLEAVRELAASSDAAAYAFGLFHLNVGDWQAACIWFEHALALRPDFAQACAGLAVALQKLGRPLDALAAFEAILRLNPSDHEALHLSGTILQSLGGFPKRSTLMTRHSASNPTVARLCSTVARCWTSWGGSKRR